jgi:hypothetical protein
MAAKRPAKPKRRIHFGWRGPLTAILLIVGVISLIGFLFVHWTERQILTTDNWIKIVGPLPKNDQVASSLSTYTVDKLFTGVDLEAKVAQALPEQASFLAPPITERLQVRITQATKRFIQSDQFQNIWIAANKTAHQKLMESARGTEQPPPKAKTAFNLDISSIRENIQQRLGRDSQPLFSGPQSAPSSNKVSLKASISTRLENFRKFVKTVDFLNGTLWLAALALLLGAFVLSHKRRKLFLIIGIAVLIISLLQIIGLNAVRPAILNHIQDQAFRPAVGVVYDSLTVSFKHGASLLAFISATLILIVFFAQAKFMKKNKFISKEQKALKKSRFYSYMQTIRSYTRQYWWYIVGTLVVIGLGIGAFAVNLDWQGVIRLTLVIIIAIELVSLLATRSKQGTA